MKSLTLFVIATSICLASCGQDIPESKVPSVVLNAVQAKFPGISNVDWEKKKDHYEAEFKKDSVEYTLQIDATGRVIQQKRDLENGAIPAAIQAAVSSAHAGYVIDDVDIIEKNGTTIYEVELEAKGKKDLKIFYSADGKVVTNS